MIIPNGTIEFKEKAPGGIDPATGYPSKPKTASWSEPIPDSEQLRLTDASGKYLGEFSLISPPEPLAAVCEIKLLV